MINNSQQDFIRVFCLKANGNVLTDVKPDIVGQLLGFTPRVTREMVSYFSQRGMIDTSKGFGDAIRITSRGLDYVDELKWDKTYIKIQFIRAHYVTHPIREAYGFIFWYDVSSDHAPDSHNKITVYITDILKINWHLNFESGRFDAEKILLQIAKDNIFNRLKSGTLTEKDELFLLTSNSPDICPYEPGNLVQTKDAVYEVEIGDNVSPTPNNNDSFTNEEAQNRFRIRELQMQLEEQKVLVDEMKLRSEEARMGFRATENEDESNTLIIDYDFPDEIKPACNQYLMYFSQFLADCGIEVNTELKSTVKETLFKITPRDSNEGLERIRAALDIYLNMATNPGFNSAAANSTEIAVMQMQANVLHFQSQMMLYKSVNQMNQATIETLELNNYELKQKLAGVEAKKKDEESLIPGVVSVTSIEKAGFKVNLAELFRRMKRKKVD